MSKNDIAKIAFFTGIDAFDTAIAEGRTQEEAGRLAMEAASKCIEDLQTNQA